MSTLVGGSEKTTEVLKDLGVNIFNSQGKFIGMKGVIEQLGPKLDGLSQKNQIFAEKTLFGAGAYQVMGSVIQSGVGPPKRRRTQRQRQGLPRLPPRGRPKRCMASSRQQRGQLRHLPGLSDWSWCPS